MRDFGLMKQICSCRRIIFVCQLFVIEMNRKDIISFFLVVEKCAMPLFVAAMTVCHFVELTGGSA